MKNNTINNKFSYEFHPPSVSVVIINFNGIKYLGKILDNCIKSTLNNDYNNFEVIFIDNASSDSSVEHVKNKFGYDSRIKIIALKNNLGTSGAKNIGIKNSKSKYVLLLNNDIYLKKETLKNMINLLEKNPDIGLLSCKLVSHKGEVQDEGRFFSDELSLLWAIYPSLLKRKNMMKIKLNKIGNLNIVDWFTGAALMLRRNLVIKLNLYDEDYFMYSEEVDLAYRVKKAGYKVACLNNYEVIHYGNVTARHFSNWRRDLFSRNLLLFIIKNYSRFQLASSLFIFILKIFTQIVNSLLTLDDLELKSSFSKIKAFWYIKEPARIPH